LGKQHRIMGTVEISHNKKGSVNTPFLDGYFSIRLGLSGDMESDLEKLCEFYNERMNDVLGNTMIKETLLEYANLFNARGLNGPEVIAEKISIVSRKGDDKKKNLNYLVGCFRNVLEYGISSTGSDIEKRLVKTFQDRYKITLTTDGVTQLLSLAASFGTTEVLFSLLETSIDIESLLLKTFESVLIENYKVHEKG
jgi:hypothetical protein